MFTRLRTLGSIQSSRYQGRMPSTTHRKSSGAWQKISRALMSVMSAYFGFSLPRNTRCMAHKRKAAVKSRPSIEINTMTWKRGSSAWKAPTSVMASDTKPARPGSPRAAKKPSVVSAQYFFCTCARPPKPFRSRWCARS